MKAYHHNENQYAEGKKAQVESENWRKVNFYCNIGSVLSLAIGIIFLTIFFININMEEKMSDNKNTRPSFVPAEHTKSINTFPTAQAPKPPTKPPQKQTDQTSTEKK